MFVWARAYEIALHEKNVLIYSIKRTSERESLFKWVGVIVPIDFYFYALAESPIPNDLKWPLVKKRLMR